MMQPLPCMHARLRGHSNNYHFRIQLKQYADKLHLIVTLLSVLLEKLRSVNRKKLKATQILFYLHGSTILANKLFVPGDFKAARTKYFLC